MNKNPFALGAILDDPRISFEYEGYSCPGYGDDYPEDKHREPHGLWCVVNVVGELCAVDLQ